MSPVGDVNFVENHSVLVDLMLFDNPFGTSVCVMTMTMTMIVMMMVMMMIITNNELINLP